MIYTPLQVKTSYSLLESLNDIESEITEGINIIPVKTMDDVVAAALRK